MSRRRPWECGGGMLIEIVLVLVTFSVVVAAVLGILTSDWRFQSAQREMARTHAAMRVALELLVVELRSVSPALGDLYGIAPDSVALRSSSGFGSVCHVDGARLAVRRVWGAFGDDRGDSVLVFREGRRDRAADDVWVSVAVQAVHSGGAGTCPDGQDADITLVASTALDSIDVGAPVRGFRPYVYRLYRGGDGNWWLGQRLRGGSIQPITGPLLPPGEEGLRLQYLSGSGTSVRTPADVVRVRVSVRGRSRVPVYRPGGRGFVVDSLSTLVYLRNS